MQDFSNPNANALELLQFCNKPSIYLLCKYKSESVPVYIVKKLMHL